MSTYRIMSWMGGNHWFNEDGCTFTGTPYIDPTTGQTYLHCEAAEEEIYVEGKDDEPGEFVTTRQSEEWVRVDAVGKIASDLDFPLPPDWTGHVINPPGELLPMKTQYVPKPRYRSIFDAHTPSLPASASEILGHPDRDRPGSSENGKAEPQ